MSRFGTSGELHGYDVGQVCLNGHVITQFGGTRPEYLKKFCDKCGEPTLIACPKCSKPIQGYHQGSGGQVNRSLVRHGQF
jgi:hypothetical protein